MRAWNVIAVEDDHITYEWEGWKLDCTWPKRAGRSDVITMMRVWFTGMDGGNVMAKTRINILSASAVNGVRMAMQNADTTHEKRDLMYFLNDVRQNLLEWYEQDKQAVNPDPTKVEETVPWLVYPVWPATGVTGIAAAPGTYKSFMAQAIALSLHYATPLLTRNLKVPEVHKILYLDWEADADTFARRLGALQRGAGLPVEPVLTYKQLTTSLHDSVPALRELIVNGEFSGVVVDSMSGGIGSGMVDDEGVNSFYDGIHQMKVPALMLAHKSAENIAKKKARFFGSVMSEARVRMAWNAEASEDEAFIRWECFKDNNHGMKGAKYAWEIEKDMQGEDEARRLITIAFTGTNPDNVLIEATGSGGGPSEKAWHEAYYLLIERGPLESGELAEQLGVTSATVRSWLQRSSGALQRVEGGKIAAVAGKVQR